MMMAMSRQGHFLPHWDPISSKLKHFDMYSISFAVKIPSALDRLFFTSNRFRNALQAYFFLHCYRCHIVARFSTSPHLDESPAEAVNNPRMFVGLRLAQVNERLLLALHATSFCCRISD